MVMDFSIVSIEPSLLDNAIIIYYSKDVDPDSVSPDNIFVMRHDSRAAVPFDIEVDEDFVKIISKTGFEPNTDYIILVQAGISDLVGTELPDPLMRQVHFGGDVTNTVRIVKPIDFELVHEIHLQWSELDKNGNIIADKDVKDAFEVQIAHENAFYNLVYSTVTGVGDLSAALMEPFEDGQYYFRVRARRDAQFGRWSNVGTFVFKRQSEEATPKPPLTDDTPTERERTDDGITIVDFAKSKGILSAPAYQSVTETGDTGFRFVFDEPIDISGMSVTVRRGDV